jgi:hypothetical protein
MTLLPGSHRTAGAPSHLRRSRGVLALVAAAAVTTACGADTALVESEFLHGAGGVHARVGDVLLRDVSLDEPADGSFERGDVARLRLVLFNEAPAADVLTDVSTPVAADVRLLVDADCDGTAERLGAVPLPPQPPVARPAPTPPDGPEPFYRVDVVLDEALRAGESVPVRFTFANAGSTTVQVPVELAAEADRDDDAECEPVA